jgi:hypothetical protein
MIATELKPEDITVGKWYRGKNFRAGIFGNINNDRVVVWISPNRTEIQYDGDTVKMGQRRPIIPMEKFMKWVKDEVPEGNPT